MDTDAVPLGERALQGILDHVLEVGDAAETSYLEVKSTLNFKVQLSFAKIAKFLLGVSNRRPTQAIRHFQGHAVLVIGAEKGRAQGVPKGIEPHQLEDKLRQYLGSQFPAFEFGRISVDTQNEVLFIIAQPPRDGQPIFPCHRDFQGDDPKQNLMDGAIYYRAGSNTRVAKSGEVLDLVERARGGVKPQIKLTVEAQGPVTPVTQLDQMMDRLYMAQEEKFLQESANFESSNLPDSSIAGMFGRLGQPTAQSRQVQLANWKRKKAEHIIQGRAHFLGVVLDGITVRVVSHGRFIAKPVLILTFEDCEAFRYQERDSASFQKVIEPIAGRRNPTGGLDLSEFDFRGADYPLDWEQRNRDVAVTIKLDSLRPDIPWQSEKDDFVLLPRDEDAGPVQVKWVLTEQGNDDVIKGDFLMTIKSPIKAVAALRQYFLDA